MTPLRNEPEQADTQAGELEDYRDPREIEVIRFPEWQKSKANKGIQWYYPEAKPGHRCLWSCRWILADNTRLEPRHIYKVEDLTKELELLELHDIANQGGRFALEAGQILINAEEKYPDWRVPTLIHEARQLYNEYLSFWNPPAVHRSQGGRTKRLIQVMAWRPGYPVPQLKDNQDVFPPSIPTPRRGVVQRF